MQKQIQFGVDYYPEDWSPERWRIDLDLMTEMGMDVVRVAEFAWSSLEPAPGVFTFKWLDEFLAQALDHGIKVVLGTPTAAPPAWLIAEHPDIQPIDAEGRVRHFGGRHHDCQSNPHYRAAIRRYVTAFAEHFGQHPAVVGWQIDNELGNSHGDLCFCDFCQANFRRWLQAKYHSLAALNANWGTTFWSQTYTDWDQVHAPILTVTGTNPSQALDWRRCHADLIDDFHQFQAAIIRPLSPGRFLTHNMMGFSGTTDYQKLATQLDFASQDQYPGGHFLADSHAYHGDHNAADLDFIRSVKHQTYWIMEQQTTLTGWETIGRLPQPGQIGLWSIQSVAHGADAIVYFRWRSSPMGTEQFWHGILPHSGQTGRVFEEIKAFIARNKKTMKAINGGTVKAHVAILFDNDNKNALAIQPQHPKMGYVDHLMTYYAALHRKNVPVEFLAPTEDLSGFAVVIAPLTYLLDPAVAGRLRDYVQNGGHLVADIRAGVKLPNNLCDTTRPLPGALTDVLGLQVLEYDSLTDTDIDVQFGDRTLVGTKWEDLLTLTTAKPLATYASEWYAGTPAIARNRFGKGVADYVGTEMTPALADAFVAGLTELTGLADTPTGIEVVERDAQGLRYLFVLNHTANAYTPSLPGWQLREGDAASIAGYDYAVYTKQK